MKKGLWLLLALCLLTAAAAEAQDVLDAFLDGDCVRVEGMLSEEARAVIGSEELAQAWQMQLQRLGAFVEIQAHQQQDNTHVLTLLHENGVQNLIVSYDEAQQIAGLMLQPVPLAASAPTRSLPEGAMESDVRLFAGTAQELCARLIRPAAENAPYAVLAQGSGPSDMDETIAANKPLRDLAYDLAALGVGSIRFDKITYAHPELPCETVEQEYLIPVREALRVLRAEAEGAKVYLIGHSQGGMLMPWLVRECGFDGGAALAGTPMKLWEISYQQNVDTIALLPAEQQAALLAQVEGERARAEGLAQLTDEEARGSTVFGVNAYYHKYMEGLDQIAIAKETGKPMLFLWGENDVQVSREAFEAWRSGLGEGGLYEYVSLPGLNHLFMPSDGSAAIADVMNEYAVPSAMDARVAQAIALWLE